MYTRLSGPMVWIWDGKTFFKVAKAGVSTSFLQKAFLLTEISEVARSTRFWSFGYCRKRIMWTLLGQEARTSPMEEK